MIRLRADVPAARGDLRVTSAVRRSHVDSRSVSLDPASFLPRPQDTNSISTSGNITVRWRRNLDEGGNVQFFSFFDHRELESNLVSISRDRFEVRGRHTTKVAGDHEIVWGFRARGVHERVNGTITTIPDENTERNGRISLFARDTIGVSDRVDVILGSKFSYNSYTGFEVQPSVRSLWRVASNHTVWAAMSRAVRVPSRVETETVTRIGFGAGPGGAPIVVRNANNGDLDAEVLRAYEVGYRGEPTKRTRMSITAFYNNYDRLVNVQPVSRGFARSPLRFVVDQDFTNAAKAHSFGAEVHAGWQVTPSIDLTATYSFLDLTFDSGSPLPERPVKSARHQGSLRAGWQVRNTLRADLTFRAAGALPGGDMGARMALDARMSWEPEPGFKIDLVGRNLVHTQRQEFFTQSFPNIAPSKAERSLFLSTRVTF